MRTCTLHETSYFGPKCIFSALPSSLVLPNSLDLFSIAVLLYMDVHCSPVLPEAVCDN